METLIKSSITTTELKKLISEMQLDNTLDNIQNYHNFCFENTESLEKEDCFFSIKISVWTALNNDNIIIEDVSVSDVELWINEDEEVQLTDNMLEVIGNEIEIKVKELV